MKPEAKGAHGFGLPLLLAAEAVRKPGDVGEQLRELALDDLRVDVVGVGVFVGDVGGDADVTPAVGAFDDRVGLTPVNDGGLGERHFAAHGRADDELLDVVERLPLFERQADIDTDLVTTALLTDSLRAEERSANLPCELEFGHALGQGGVGEPEIELVFAFGHTAVDVAKAAVGGDLSGEPLGGQFEGRDVVVDQLNLDRFAGFDADLE